MVRAPAVAPVPAARESDIVEVGGVARERHDLVGSTPITRSLSMRRLGDDVDRAVESDAPVLVFGEPGTSTEDVAREIHERSRGEGAPFIVVRCSDNDEAELEASLFGVRRGGEIDARSGALARAVGGTLFLDAIDDMPPSLQARLSAELGRLAGGAAAVRPLRIIASTTRPPQKLVAHGKLRAHLARQLEGVVIQVPPLREQQGDGLSPLEAPPGVLGIDTDLSALTYREMLAMTKERSTREYLVALLRRFDGKVANAASHAGIERESFYRLVKRFNLDAGDYRSE